jgi:hypothetical protein
MIEFACHQCKTRLKVKDSASGQTVACPRCQTSLTIPGDKSAPIAPLKSSIRHPLGDPPPGESSDPAQRVVELSAQNRELQEKLRRKETELELARLKIADLAKFGASEPKPTPETETPNPVPPAPSLPAVEVPAPASVPLSPISPTKGWGIRVVLVIGVAIIALLIWSRGRPSRSAPVSVSAEPKVSVPTEPKSSPAQAVPPEPTPIPPPAVTSAPMAVIPEVAPSPAKEPEPAKMESLAKQPEAVPVVAPTNGSAELASPVPSEPSMPSGVSP